MNELPFFPYPHVWLGKRKAGCLREWPERCVRCSDRPCENINTKGVGLCKYGFNFLRLDEALLIAGIVLSDYQPVSPAWKKRRRQVRPVHNADFEGAVASYQALRAEERAALAAAERTAQEHVLDEEQFRVEYLANLKAEVLKGLSFVHDYKQINTQIIQNINVIIEKRYSGESLDDKLRQATREEQAIYWAGRFLDEKLNVAKFLVRPEWLRVQADCSRFRVHGMVMKYMKMYEPLYEERHIRLKLIGQSHGEVIANNWAIGVIPHTLIDNALKYAPPGSAVEVYLDDTEDGVHLEVSSYGPAIEPDEMKTIFRPFTRGRAATSVATEGAGYGLYVSQLVAVEHLGTEITVEQDRSKCVQGDRYLTTFAVLLPSRAAILGER